MRTVCKQDMCAGCMACIEKCPKDAIVIQDTKYAYNAIKKDSCIECGACEQVCPVNNQPNIRKPIKWMQGWANDNCIRDSSSSGGFATAISTAFIQRGGIVCSCTFKNGSFIFSTAENESEVRTFQGSKYVKSDPSAIYKQIVNELKNCKKVLFIGLPCQSAAVQNYVPSKLLDNLFTIDLICHGTPSIEILKQFLNEKGYNLSQLHDIHFRNKNQFCVTGAYRSIVPQGVTDRYTIGFLNGLFYTENCYHCQYARLERVSDLTLGDSWGSTLSLQERKRGISLALCQTKKGQQLLDWANLHFEPVDIEKAEKANLQLITPSQAPECRKMFFEGLNKGISFHALVTRCYTNRCLRQDIKHIMINLPIIGKLVQNRFNRYGGELTP